MTVNIKGLKAPPLLNLPGEVEWRLISDEDVEHMRLALMMARVINDPFKGLKVAKMLFHMKGAGVPERVTEEDMKLMLSQLSESRRDGSAFNIIEMHHYLKGLGIEVPVIEKDVTRAANINLFDVAHPLESGYQMLKSGIETSITGLDDFFRLEIEEYRLRGIGLGILSCHHMLRELGIPTEITPEDMRAIKAAMARYRKEQDGAHIAEMHHYIQHTIPPTEEKHLQPAIPPLKRFLKD